MAARETKFKIGNYYKNNPDGAVYICVDNTLEASFDGMCIWPGHRGWAKTGERENMLSKSFFEEIYPDQIPGFHTSIKNTHPITDNGTKLQVPGPQGQIAETKRRDFWCRTVIAYTNASNSSSSDIAIAWADKCLDAFDKRFNNK